MPMGPLDALGWALKQLDDAVSIVPQKCEGCGVLLRTYNDQQRRLCLICYYGEDPAERHNEPVSWEQDDD